MRVVLLEDIKTEGRKTHRETATITVEEGIQTESQGQGSECGRVSWNSHHRARVTAQEGSWRPECMGKLSVDGEGR